ncbi:MAG: bacteriorhodopsin [Verrucomicrobiota bacterium]
MPDTENALGNATFENYVGLDIGFTEMGYQLSAHTLTLGYATMLAALLYFVMTIKQVAPRFRMSSILSGVVMVSAALLLYVQATNWTDAFAFDPATGLYMLQEGKDLFNNGYRYLNWLIDVPMLLFQILFVVTLTKSKFSSVRNRFWISGTLMIATGYAGQFYEVTNPTVWLIWGAISTVFFIDILYVMKKKVINEGKEGIPADAAKTLESIWWLFLISWMLYPGAYLMPLMLDGEAGVVGRHITYTVADITSKIIYGVLLSLVAMKLSKAEGYVSEEAVLK